MSIKEIAHAVSQQIEAGAGVPFSRAHFYELLAAAFGHRSYAALVSTSAVFASRTSNAKRIDKYRSGAGQRCRSLGYGDGACDLIVDRIMDAILRHKLDAASVADIAAALTGFDGDADFVSASTGPIGHARITLEDLCLPTDDETDVAVLMDSLVMAAKRENASAHYAVALLHRPGHLVECDQIGSQYWSQREAAGVRLSDNQLEWAEAYEHEQLREQRHVHHLRRAASLEHKDALVDLARFMDDPAVFDRGADLSDEDPAEMAELARGLDRQEAYQHWLRKAAEAGDIDAMIDLIESHDAQDARACWKWMYLAELFGTDLSRDDFRAIHEDETDYDDDVGGPAFVKGRSGITLPALPAADDDSARAMALTLYGAHTKSHALRMASRT